MSYQGPGQVEERGCRQEIPVSATAVLGFKDGGALEVDTHEPNPSRRIRILPSTLGHLSP